MDLKKLIKFTPEDLGVTPTEFNRIEKRTEKVLNFMSEFLPITMYNLTEKNYREEFYPFLDVMSSLLMEFTIGDKKKLDYKHFPWKKNIKKRLHEKYGF